MAWHAHSSSAVSDFAGLYLPCDTTSIDAIQSGRSTRHEGHLGEIKANRQNLGHCFGSTRSLQRQELHRVLQVLHGNIATKRRHLFFKMNHVTKLGGTIDDHVDVVTGVGNDGIINDTAFFVCDQGKAAVTRSEPTNVTQDNLFDKGNSVLSVPFNLLKLEVK
jgi:hypothetical protein